jgi:hypothetical protein
LTLIASRHQHAMGYEFSKFELLDAFSKAIDQVARAGSDQACTATGELLSLRELERIAPKLASVASSELSARRARAAYFRPPILGEPAWNMLLDLFVQHNAGTGVSVTSATIASGAPQATALRYVALMQREGLIERCSSKIDRRVCYLRLTQEGYRRIGTWLSSYASTIA